MSALHVYLLENEVLYLPNTGSGTWWVGKFMYKALKILSRHAKGLVYILLSNEIHGKRKKTKKRKGQIINIEPYILHTLYLLSVEDFSSFHSIFSARMDG